MRVDDDTRLRRTGPKLGGFLSHHDPDGAATVARVLPVRRSTLSLLIVWSAAAVVLLVTTVPVFRHRVGLLGSGGDFYMYRHGAHYLMAGWPLYDAPLDNWLPYTYPPFSALTFVWFGLLPAHVDKFIWFGVNVVLLILVVAQCWRFLGYRLTGYLWCVSVLLGIVCAFLDPVRDTLLLGQINLLLLLLVLCDTGAGRRNRFRGVGVGLAAGIKVTPVYFVGYYLVLRQWRAAAVAVATIGATIVVGWIAAPRDSLQYWTRVLFDFDRVSWDVGHPGNQSLRGALTRLTGVTPDWWWWLLADLGVVLVSMWLVVRLHRRGERLLAVIVTGMSSAVVSPFSWNHHWVWFVPLLVYLVHRAMTNRWWWLAATALFVVVGAWPYRYPGDEEAVVGFYMFPPAPGVPWHVLVNLYLVIYLVILAGSAITIRSAKPQP